MDFELPEDTLMLRDMLRRFVSKEAQPLEMKYFTAGFLTPEERARLQRAVEQMGLWGLTIPEAYGGGGLDLVSTCVIEEELGKTFIPVEIGDVPPALYACTGDQVGNYLEPALAGERRAVIAAREPGALQPENWDTVAETGATAGYLLSGRKLLSVSPGGQDFLIVYARAPEGPTAFVLDIDLPGMKISANGAVMLTLDGLQAQAGAVLGSPGGALRLGIEEAPRAWIRSGARYVGMVDRLILMSLEHARDWISLGEALAVRPAIQRMLAEMRVEVESSRWLTFHAAWLADQGAGDELRNAAAQVRLATGEMLKRAVDRVTMIFTGPGPAPQVEPQRFVRSLAPPEALDLALEQARAVILADMLGTPTP
jgi:alkylation response protein AidB-like acyl-CoA dehydrogenase